MGRHEVMFPNLMRTLFIWYNKLGSSQNSGDTDTLLLTAAESVGYLIA
jgi:hypothetical protein